MVLKPYTCTVHVSVLIITNIYIQYVHVFLLHFRIQHLESSAKPLDVIVQGNSLVPYCHFDLPESDYLRARRPTNVSDSTGCVTGRIDQSSKVIEFIAKGTGVRIIRSD